MTTLAEATRPAAREILDAVAELTPTIAARADEIEAARRLPPDLLEHLKKAGCFRMVRPPSLGGAGLSLPEVMRVIEALSEADASVGWTTMIGSGAWIDIAGMPRASLDALFADDPDAIVGGAFAPTGVAMPENGGYRVNGRWAFASGCEHSDWLYGNCVEDAGGDHRLRIALFAPEQVQIEDTWHVAGLKGTGSHHFTADDVFVPAERTVAVLEDPPSLDDPMVSVPPVSLIPGALTSAALGVARGAMADIVALAAGKVPLLAPGALATNPLFQHELATADTELRAARGLAYAEADALWAAAKVRAELTPEQRARIRATGAWATARAAAVVDFAYRAGGGSALYDASPLQRRFRDVHAITQHFLNKPDTLTTAGALLMGQDIDVPIF